MDPTPSSPTSSSLLSKRPRARVSPGPESMDRLLESLLALSDPGVSLDLSLERVVESRASEPDKDLAVDAAMRVGSALLESAKRSARKRASRHNSYSWPLPSELTIKVLNLALFPQLIEELGLNFIIHDLFLSKRYAIRVTNKHMIP